MLMANIVQDRQAQRVGRLVPSLAGDRRVGTLVLSARACWMLGRLGMAAGVVTLAGVLGGVFTWLGAAAQHTGLSFTNIVGAGFNTVPAGVCLLGIGVLVWAVVPRLASAGVYAVLAWSFLVELLGGIVNSSHWSLDTSIFHQLAPAPATAPDWASNAALLGLGVAASLVSAFVFSRRDLAGE